MSMDYQISHTSRLGNRRHNEDSLDTLESEDCLLLVLADGMGGHGGGKLASETLITHVRTLFGRSKKPVSNPHSFLRHIINEAHYAIIDSGYQCTPPLQPRTTCVLALIQQDMLWTAHLGDSRCYLIRNGQVNLRTRDHSIIEELLQLGRITPDQASTHPERNMVTRCVGGELSRAEASLSGPHPLQHEDVILLCSDGLWSGVTEHDLGQTLAQHTVDQAVQSLANQAEMQRYPSADNISLIALRWHGHKTEPDTARIDTPVAVAPQSELDQAISTLQKVMAQYEGEL